MMPFYRTLAEAGVTARGFCFNFARYLKQAKDSDLNGPESFVKAKVTRQAVARVSNDV